VLQGYSGAVKEYSTISCTRSTASGAAGVQLVVLQGCIDVIQRFRPLHSYS